MTKDKVMTPGCCETCVHEERDYYEFPCNECIRDTGNSDMYLPKPAEAPRIKDSGERRVFETGAVRDITEDKGRCDLLPLDVVADYLSEYGRLDKKMVKVTCDEATEAWLDYSPLEAINNFTEEGEVGYLKLALRSFQNRSEWDAHSMFLELAKHFADGAKKYSENNWKNGIPAKSYIDSAVRHLLKHLRGDKDERHDRAFCWNIVCCIWTCKHKPELNDYAKKEETND